MHPLILRRTLEYRYFNYLKYNDKNAVGSIRLISVIVFFGEYNNTLFMY